MTIGEQVYAVAAARSKDSGELALLRMRIARQLAEGHGRPWDGMDDVTQVAYLADAEAVVDQGLGSSWQDPGEPPAALTPAMEAEVFAFDQAVAWFYQYLESRHGPVDLATAAELNDPADWDAWVSVLAGTSELIRRAWSRRISGDAADPNASNTAPPPLSEPDAANPAQSRYRLGVAIAATLANRHGYRWLDLSRDRRELYLRDADLLIESGLSALG